MAKLYGRKAYEFWLDERQYNTNNITVLIFQADAQELTTKQILNIKKGQERLLSRSLSDQVSVASLFQRLLDHIPQSFYLSSESQFNSVCSRRKPYAVWPRRPPSYHSLLFYHLFIGLIQPWIQKTEKKWKLSADVMAISYAYSCP